MFPQSKIAFALWLVAIALLPIRMANAHLHLCLDGQERPVTFHVQDVPTHHGAAGAPSGHNDVDLDVPPSVSAKKVSNADELSPAILGAYVLSLLLPEYPHFAPQVWLLAPPSTPQLDLRPPTRGPPA